MLEVAGFFAIKAHAALDFHAGHFGVVQRRSRQFAHTLVRPVCQGQILVGTRIEHPNHPQALRERGVINRVSQPLEARDFSLGGFAGFGQRGEGASVRVVAV